MEKYLFAASIGALPSSLLLLNEIDRTFVRDLPGHCNTLLDGEPLLRPSAIHPHLACMGHVGREMYLNFYQLDLFLFPMIYSMVLSGILFRVWPSNTGGGGTAAMALRVVPFAGAFADTLENSGICFLLLQFPARFEGLEIAISVFSRIKWLGFIASLALVVAGAGYRFVQHLRPASNQEIATPSETKSKAN